MFADIFKSILAFSLSAGLVCPPVPFVLEPLELEKNAFCSESLPGFQPMIPKGQVLCLDENGNLVWKSFREAGETLFARSSRQPLYECLPKMPEKDVPLTEDGIRQHTINTVRPGWSSFDEDLLQAVEQFSTQSWAVVRSDNHPLLLGQIVADYCGLGLTATSNMGGNYVEGHPEILLPDDGTYASIRQALPQAKEDLDAYGQYVLEACRSLNLEDSDLGIADQAFAWICSYFSYAETDCSMLQAVQSRTGQCYHFARMMTDICNALSVPARTVSDGIHAWCIVDSRGTSYLYDPTSSILPGSLAGYSYHADNAVIRHGFGV